MARLGDDVYQWDVEQLGNWLRSEGFDDCVETFTWKKIDGCKLLNLSDVDFRSLHISHESKKKLIKTVEKFKKRKKGNIDRMFGNKDQAQRVPTRKTASFSHDEEESDGDGWGTDEWDSSGEEDNNESSDGEYLEPEDDFSKPTGSPFKKEAPLFQAGLVAQLREGIAESLRRGAAPQQDDQYYEGEDEDIYDEPPQEEDLENEDLYEEPSDSSGGAVVVRPPPKPPRIENGPAYLVTRGEESQDTYEAPIEGEDLSQSPSNKQRFIPTKVQPQPQRYRGGQQDMNRNNIARHQVQEFSDDEYEVPETKTKSSAEVPPPRPPKNLGTPASTPSSTPARPPKQKSNPPSSISSTQPQKTVFRKPPTSSQAQESSQGNSFPQQQKSPQHKTSGYPQRQGGGLPLPGGAPRSPGHLPNKPTLPSKQGSPSHSNAFPDPARQPKQTFSAHGSAFQGIPMQKPQLLPKKTKPVPLPTKTLPTEEKRTPKPRPKPSDPIKREPAPPPGAEPPRKLSGSKTGPPDSPTRHEPTPRKKSDPPSPHIMERRPECPKPQLPVATPDAGRISPRPSTLPVGRDQPPPLPPNIPSKSGTGQQHRRSGPLPVAPGQERPPEPPPSEPAAPPRPPKKGTPQPATPPIRQSAGDKKGVPLPAPPTASFQSARDAREQSSGSSLESGSADEPVVQLPSPNRPLPGGRRKVLPQTPTEKSALDTMKEAPWFHGSVDRKKSEANLKLTNMDGAFLVRNSTKNPNDYSMSLLHQGNVVHLQIPKKDGQYVLGASGIQKFNTIIELVGHYRQNEVDLRKGGKTKLTIHAQNIS